MITPMDIESKEFKKVAMGYSTTDVEKFLNEVLVDYEKLYKDNVELKDKIAMLNEGLHYYKSLEQTIQNTMILAEKSAEEIKVAAHKKGEQIITEAEKKSMEILYEANIKQQDISMKVMNLQSEFEVMKVKVKMLLNTQLQLLDEPTSSDNVLS